MDELLGQPRPGHRGPDAVSPFLQLDDLVKRFDGTVAVDRVSLALERGEMLALLGPSGSGKTTTLRLLAGFESPDAGRVLVDGDDVTRVEPVRRRFGMVFQHYALFPHLDVGANVAFGLESLGVRGAELERRVGDALALVDLAGFERRRIGQLSGGQQQRVALARALAPEPRVLLLDEPLSNLDPSLRERTRRELRELIRRLGITTVLVTHEQEEAFDLGDRVAVMRQGRLEQVGTPDALYAEPANLFVGGFVGRSSVVPVMVLEPVAGGKPARISVEGVEWEIEGAGALPAGPAEMLVRPEALRLTPPDAGGLPVTVSGSRFVGPGALFGATTEAGAALEVMAPVGSARPGDRAAVMPSRRAGAGIHLYPVNGA
jgi:ABC-type Fe3+/spermidine/putrescine transport system ATPase subunit